MTMEKMRRTKGRDAVLRVLSEKDKPLTYEEVYVALLSKENPVHVSTTYRILEAFVETGVVRKINGGANNRSLYELARDEHRHYFYCTSCRTLLPIGVETCPVKNMLEDLTSTMHVEIHGHKLELYGLCSRCLLKDEFRKSGPD
jgi:Fur family ferric uptake transcriptional regulator